MSLWKRNPPQAAPGGDTQMSQPRPNVSVSVPLHRIVRVRKLWLGFMFFLGMSVQFLMAIYTPVVWNAIYELIKNFLPT